LLAQPGEKKKKKKTKLKERKIGGKVKQTNGIIAHFRKKKTTLVSSVGPVKKTENPREKKQLGENDARRGNK